MNYQDLLSSMAGPLGSSGTTAGSGMSGQLQSSLQALQDAINQGDQRQYDIALGQLLGVFNGQNTLEEQKLMGIGANGQPTLDALTEAEKQREANLSAQSGLLDMASKLTGPKDYGDFMAMTGGGRSLMQQLLAGRPSSSAPVGDMEPMDLYSLLQKFGMGPGQSATANPAPGPNFLRTGSPITGATGGGGGGGTDPMQPDNTTPLPSDANLFPTMANDSDIAYAKAQAAANAAYDPNSYQAYMAANGGSADWQPQVTTEVHSMTPDLQMPYAMPSRGGALNVWGAGDVGKDRATLHDFLGNGSDNVPGLAIAQMLGADPSQGTSQYDNLNNLTDRQIGQVMTALMTPKDRVTTQTSGTGPPSWFNDYMKALIGLGPNVNRGAAENLPLLYQLGLANPTGMGQMLNPAGNIDPAKWDSLGPVGQSLLSQAAGKVFGWDPTVFQQQIDATRPLGSPVSGVSVGYSPLALAQ